MIKKTILKTIKAMEFEYETFEEQLEHVKDMLKDGWNVVTFEALKVEYSKIEDERKI